MTVIAYRNGILASDSLVVQGTTRNGEVDKIVKTEHGWLVGGAGRVSAINELIAWAEAGMDFDDCPSDSKDMNAILVDPKGKVYLMEEDYKPFLVKSKFTADGCGADLAIGAMEMGASAEEAVKIAIKHSTGCGGRIKVVKL